MEHYFEITVFIFEWLRDVNPNLVSDAFLILILVTFVLGCIQVVAKWERLKELASTLPSQLNAIGILGTFVGISIGLAAFDTENIPESVPRLLAGLKLAFSTSIAGLVSSTSLRGFQSLWIALEASWSDDDNSNGGGAGGRGTLVVDNAALLALRMIDMELERGFESGDEGMSSLRDQLDRIEKALGIADETKDKNRKK